jgi:hypothetical protein
MRLFQPETRERRLLGAVFSITFMIAVLLTAFFQTQVLQRRAVHGALGGEPAAADPDPGAARHHLRPQRRDRRDQHPRLRGDAAAGEREVIGATLSDLAPFLGLSRPRTSSG